MSRKAALAIFSALCALPILFGTARAEVLIQYFETEWDEIYRRLPEMAEIGYDGLWLPPPNKSPHAGGQYAGGGNVGYSHYDKFDLGDIPQRGSRATRYGTRGSLRNLTDNAHQMGIRNYPDIVMNHTGNGPDYRTYPGTRPNDFHGWWDGGQPGGFKRTVRMSNYGDVANGYGRTFQEELVSLIDFQTERDTRFTANAPNFSTPPSFTRHPGQLDKYPYGTILTNESTIGFLNRWITWLGNAMDFDGVRLDAPKHVVADFFGLPGDPDGFLHNIQYNYDIRRGFTDYTNNATSFEQLYLNYQDRDDALIFSEFFIGGVGEVDYWRVNYGNKLRYLDFPRKSSLIGGAFGGGNLSALNGFAGFDPAEGVVFCQSHDESPPGKLDLAYVYVLTHVGLPVVFFTGNNLSGSDVNTKTWMKTGYGSALGDYNWGAIPNLVFVNQNFARGKEYNRWGEGDFFVFERYDDKDNDSNPDSGEGLLLVGLNDSGSDQTRNNVQTSFAPGTVLKSYSVHGGGNLTVNGSGQVNLTIPAGNNGQGWVCYAPRIAEANGDPLRFEVGGNPAPTISWVVPGGRLASDKPRTVVRLTQDTVDINAHYVNPADGAVDAVMLKWGLGQRVHPTNYFSPTVDNVSGKFQSMNVVSSNGPSGTGQYRLTATLTNIPEGLHLVRARPFVGRTGTLPALFQTFGEAVYVDRHGPDLSMVYPAQNQTVEGSTVAVITNGDKTAYYMEYSVNGGSYAACDEVQKGEWKALIPALASGTHTVAVRALEADWGSPRNIINTSTLTRVFNVNAGGPAASLAFQGINRGVGSNFEMPFFKTLVTAAGLSLSQVKLYWDGYELPLTGSAGSYSSTFDGRYLTGGTTQNLWGAFANGVHFFELVAHNGSATTRVAQRVVFNLYGSNQIDSDGDGLPDEVEMPNFFAGTSPGPNVPWPGDTSGSGNQDMIPNYGETWTRLNPMAHDTTYDGTWDDGEDWDGDGTPNGCEVRQGYLIHTNAFYFNIYNSGSKPSSCVETNGGTAIPAQVAWTPTSPNRCDGSTLTVTYVPNQGPLSNASPIMIAIGTTSVAAVHANMTSIGGGQWQHVFNIPNTASNIVFWLHNDQTNVFDNNGGLNYQVPVGACVVVTNYFVMDGTNDSPGFEVSSTGMKILAALRSNNVYVATWSANGGGNDHFVYITDAFGAPEPAAWAKAGSVFFSKAGKPYLAAEQSNGTNFLNNGGSAGRVAMGANGQVFEAEFNLEQVFGYVPEKLYIAALAYGTGDGGTIQSQGPAVWNSGNDVEIMEFLPVALASVRDENKDGIFDGGRPYLESVVNGNTNSANYNIRRFFIDELAGDSQSITFNLTLNGPGGTNVVSEVELFSNLNRRDFAVLPGDEDPDAVTTGSQTTYFRAYAMSGSGNGPYTVTLPVNKCGAYRVNARYKINGQRYYYTDHALRRDLAVVVTPKKALNVTMYELNPLTAEAQTDDFFGRSTFRDMYQVNTNKLDAVSTNYFKQLGVNMLWLQPIHPIGYDNREQDPSTGNDYDPGSPYAVRNYWQVNGVLGDPWTADGSQALAEFTNFVQAMDQNGIGVMLDGTFNHSAWDCEVGQPAVDMFDWATNASDLIRDARPQWYSKKGNYGQHATVSGNNKDDIATAPDRTDFGKWSDVADFFFGTYDTLVQGQTDAWRDRYLLQEDQFDGFSTNATRELWEYFASYPLYWLERTGHPEGTPKSQSYKGIDGLRCDFAQGLPSAFWEYTINKTRSVKWDFLFMAESLDGFRTINGDKRNGLSFRSPATSMC
jgi:glycosidase